MTCTSVFAEVICLALIVGFTIAQTASPPRWTIVSGSSYCSVSSDGMCITDGSGSYGNDENCTMRAESTMTITSTQFDTEYGYDFIRVLGGGIYSGSTGPMFVQVTAGTLVTWSTDSSSSWRTGFTICALFSPPSPPPHPPGMAPLPSPPSMPPLPLPPRAPCADYVESCSSWAEAGDCDVGVYVGYMHAYCQFSCNTTVCSTPPDPSPSPDASPSPSPDPSLSPDASPSPPPMEPSNTTSPNPADCSMMPTWCVQLCAPYAYCLTASQDAACANKPPICQQCIPYTNCTSPELSPSPSPHSLPPSPLSLIHI